MLIRDVDGPIDDDEWRAFLDDDRHRFGELVAGGGPDRVLPVIVPTHFLFDGEATILLHLARPNPVWEALAEQPRAVVSVVGDVTYVPSGWNNGVPTSYYAAVQCIGTASVLDDPEEVAALLRRQLATFQPEGGYEPPRAGEAPHGRLLAAIRGLRLEIDEVRAKFKFGGNRSPEQQLAIAEALDRRAGPGDTAARAQLLRRSSASTPADGPRRP
jgi:transcriptional regulator